MVRDGAIVGLGKCEGTASCSEDQFVPSSGKAGRPFTEQAPHLLVAAQFRSVHVLQKAASFSKLPRSLCQWKKYD